MYNLGKYLKPKLRIFRFYGPFMDPDYGGDKPASDFRLPRSLPNPGKTVDYRRPRE